MKKATLLILVSILALGGGRLLAVPQSLEEAITSFEDPTKGLALAVRRFGYRIDNAAAWERVD